MKYTGLILVAVFSVAHFSCFASTDQYSLANPYPVALIQVESDVVLELLPLVRPYIPRDGHAAALRTPGYMIVSDHPRRVAKLRELLSGLSADTLDKSLLRRQLDEQLGRRGGKHATDSFITRTIDLRSVKAKSIVPILRKLVSEGGALVAEEDSNSLTVTDYPENLEDLARLLRTVDGSTKP